MIDEERLTEKKAESSLAVDGFESEILRRRKGFAKLRTGKHASPMKPSFLKRN